MSKRKKRVKRSHLNAYYAHRVYVPRTANQDILSEYKERVSSTRGPKNGIVPLFGNTFTKEVPNTKGLQTKGEDYELLHDDAGNPVHARRKPPRQLTVERLHQLRQGDDLSQLGRDRDFSDGWRRQGIDDYLYFVYHRTAKQTWKLFFSGMRHIWILEENGYVKRSCVYKTKDAAIRAFKIPELLIWEDFYSVSD